MIERERIAHLYHNYLKQHSVTTIKTTKIDLNLSHDGYMLSGLSNTMIYFEFKRRNITTEKYSDTFIEGIKFKELYRLFNQGNKVFFIIEYNDYILFFDLEYEFYQYQFYDLDDEFFKIMRATKNMQEYNEGETQKYVRYLNYNSASIILDKEYNRVSYREFINTNRVG